MNFGQVIGEPLSLLRGEGGLLGPNALPRFAIHAKAGVGEPRVGESEIGIFVDGLFKQSGGLTNTVLGMAVAQGVPPLQVEVVGLQVLSGVSADAGLLFAGRFELKSGGDSGVDLVFNREHVAGRSRKLL